MKKYLGYISTALSALIAGLLLGRIELPKQELGLIIPNPGFLSRLEDTSGRNIEEGISYLGKVGLNQLIKVSAKLYDAGGNQLTDKEVRVWTPRQARFSTHIDKANTDDGSYFIDYAATSTGIHTIDFSTIDDANKVVNKTIYITVE